MEEIREILREKAIEEEILKEKLKETKRTGKVCEIKTEIPAATLIEQVRFKEFKNVEKPFQKMFVSEDILLKKNGQTLSIREITPKSIRYFVRDKYNFSEKDDDFAVQSVFDKEESEKIKMKIIIYGDLSKPGNLLSLLHEIGHTRLNPKLERDLENTEAKLHQAYLKSETHKPAKDEIPWRSSRQHEFRPVKKALVDRFIELKAREERDAWACALRTLRKFRRQGLDLEPEMQKLEDIQRFIYGEIGLGGYVLDFIEKTKASKIKEELLPIIKKFIK